MNPIIPLPETRLVRRRTGRALSAAVLAATALVAAVLMAPPAHADSRPANPLDPATPVTVAADALPAPQIDGVVWTQTIVGNTVFAGGQFTTARPAGVALGGAGQVVRSNLLSYNLSTGVLNASFVPGVNGAVRAIVGTSDQKHIYIGGSFTSVGSRGANHVAELDATTGAPVASFRASVNGVVTALALRGDKNTLFVGGQFSSVNSRQHLNLASITANAGLLRTWSPQATGGTVRALAIAPDYSRLVVGGSFTKLNGLSNPGYGLGSVNPVTGQHQTWAANNVVRDAGPESGFTSLVADSTGLYGAGYVYGQGGNLEGSFRADWKTGQITWVEDCHGDTYSIAVTPTAEYVAGHAHYCGNIGGFPDHTAALNYRGIAFSKATTQTIATNTVRGYHNFGGQPAPSLLSWYPQFDVGTYTGQGQGPWSVAANSQYVVYGGEFTTVNGTPQQGLVRFAVPTIAPDKMGPAKSGADFTPTLTASPYGGVTLSWAANYDLDNARLTYSVYRRDPSSQDYTLVTTTTGDSSIWKTPTMTYTDPGATSGKYFYYLVATDPFGNQATGQPTAVTVTGPTATPAPSQTPAAATTPAG